MYQVQENSVQVFEGSLQECFQFMLETYGDVTLKDLIQRKINIV